jgi:hypothetical protein
MDVRDLAPALIAIGNLASDANRVLNGDSADIRAEVHASFKAGSFGIDLHFTQNLLKQVTDLLAGQGATATANLGGILSLIGLTGGGLIALLRKLKGREPVKIEETESGSAKIFLSETEFIEEQDKRVVRLYRNREVRVSLDKLLSPLERDGIDSFGVVKNESVTVSIRSEERQYFVWQPSLEGDVVSDTTRERILLQIESVVFKDRNKWRVHDGQFGFHAAISDEEFIARIENGERFGKGDVLIADLRVIQKIVDGALLSQYQLSKVHEHRQPLQVRLT